MRTVLWIALLGFLVQLVLPWWSLALVAFGVCLWQRIGSGHAFGAGAVGSAVVWLGYALLIHVRTDGILTATMSQLLTKLHHPAPAFLFTVLISGLTGGMAGWAGALFRKAMGMGSAKTA